MNKSTRNKEIGAGLAATAVAAALGAYFLYGSKSAKSNRQKVKGWMLRAKGEILDKLEDMDEITEQGYTELVNNVLAKYEGTRKAAAPELVALAADLRKHWRALKPMFKKRQVVKNKPRPKRRKSKSKNAA